MTSHFSTFTPPTLTLICLLPNPDLWLHSSALSHLLFSCLNWSFTKSRVTSHFISFSHTRLLFYLLILKRQCNMPVCVFVSNKPFYLLVIHKLAIGSLKDVVMPSAFVLFTAHSFWLHFTPKIVLYVMQCNVSLCSHRNTYYSLFTCYSQKSYISRKKSLLPSLFCLQLDFTTKIVLYAMQCTSVCVRIVT